ncbi:hypothetical protein TorRG33x02_063290 [Trema orientale]|uniref:Uncharacterized protein n=1 Tax=Trema orientale TaxID=63057 RepID=A0A2P5FIX7_TREOI|nr:hypothetical protein TorRG33x02_063290 [Trema orientale]
MIILITSPIPDFLRFQNESHITPHLTRLPGLNNLNQANFTTDPRVATHLENPRIQITAQLISPFWQPARPNLHRQAQPTRPLRPDPALPESPLPDFLAPVEEPRRAVLEPVRAEVRVLDRHLGHQGRVDVRPRRRGVSEALDGDGSQFHGGGFRAEDDEGEDE